MQLSDKEKRFLMSRATRLRAWPFVGSGLLCLVTGGGAWLFIFRPMLANPFAVIAGLSEDTIPESTLALMAGILPLVVLLCAVLALAMVLLGFAAFANESKYQAIIRRMT